MELLSFVIARRSFEPQRQSRIIEPLSFVTMRRSFEPQRQSRIIEPLSFVTMRRSLEPQRQSRIIEPLSFIIATTPRNIAPLPANTTSAHPFPLDRADGPKPC
jgi:hypothetical protein